MENKTAISPKAQQVLDYEPSDEFVKCFDEEAKGYSHKLIYDGKRDKIFFSALTSNCSIIQIYADSMEEMEKEFIKHVRSLKK